MLLAAAEGEFELQSLNIYDPTNIELEINKTPDREFDRIRLLPDGKWQSALGFYHQQQSTHVWEPDAGQINTKISMLQFS